ncbi:MAG TPA: carboxypeptidase-like regulatory domain-containing protein, partial [Polyangiales bacterium]
GFTEAVLAKDDRHHRLALELGAAWIAASWFQIALAGEVRMDHHTPESETGWIGSSQIATRHAFQLGQSTALAFAPRVLFPGAKDAEHGLKATSVELAALLTQRLPQAVELSASLGYRIDRTRYAIDEPELLVPTQRLAASLSEHNAYQVGLLGSVPLGAAQLAVEWSWDITAGGDPDPLHSPMRVRAAVQRQVGTRWLPGVELGVDTSARPEFTGVVRIEPRVWARVSLAVRLDGVRSSSVRVRKFGAQPAAAGAQPVAPAVRTVSLDVTDPAGTPISDARVTAGGRTYRSDGEGRVVLELAPGAGDEIRIEAPGYDPITRQLGSAGAATEQRVVLAPPDPGSEIKGVVRNLASQPLSARIEVLPLGTRVNTDREGQFVIRIAPGDYKLRISAEGYETQERPAQVEPSGVTIIVVDLKRARK